MRLTRRQAIQLGAGGAIAGAVGFGLDRLLRRGPAASGDVAAFEVNDDADPAETFPLSVASGDPTPTGAVVWTRVAPERVAPSSPIGLEVAEDATFARVVHRASLPASRLGPAADHTVRADLDGLLEPDRAYHYRFVYRRAASRTGRLRTLPEPAADPRRLRLAVVTCQHFGDGHYGAFRHIAEDDVDFLVHLGDQIYEYATAGRVRGRAIELPSGRERAADLADFRHLWRTYRSDPALQAALERHTLVATWDDHEVANNWHWDYEEDRPRLPRHEADASPEASQRVLADAVQAWWEYVPNRVAYDPGAAHAFDRIRLYRTFRFGRLAELFVTDERSYRHGPPCARESDADFLLQPDCPERHDPARSMLGAAQRDWLTRGLSRSPARWKVWANGVVLQPLRTGPAGERVLVYTDAWEGFPEERRTILRAVRDAGVRNLVALTGDMHAYMAGYLQVDYDGLAASDGGNRVGVEFMTPAVTSSSFREALAAESTGAAGLADERTVLAANPHMAFFRGHGQGYSTIEVTEAACTYTAYAVNRDDPAAAREVVRVLRVPNGRVEIEEGEAMTARSAPTAPTPSI